MMFGNGVSTSVILPLVGYFVLLVHGQDTRNEREPKKTAFKFQCETEGFFPDPTDCSIFYRCLEWGDSSENSVHSRYTTFKFQCTNGLIFDPQSHSCVHVSVSSRAECKYRASEPLLFNFPRADTSMHNNDDSYNQIDYGVLKSQPTTASHLFSSYNRPSPDSSLEPINELDNMIGDPSPRNTRSPPCESEGFFPVENDCARFYRCVSNGKSFTKYDFSCGEGTVWDPDNNACNHAWAVERSDCRNIGPENEGQPNGSEPDQSGGNTDQNGNPPNEGAPNNNQNPEPEQNPSPTPGYPVAATTDYPQSGSPDYGNISPDGEGNDNSVSNGTCPSEGFHAVPNNCKKFIRCVSNGNGFTKYEFDCAEGTVWDPDLDTCNYPYAVKRSDCKSDQGGQTDSDSGTTTSLHDSQTSSTSGEQNSAGTTSHTTNSNQTSSSSNQTSTTSSQSSHQTSSTSSHQTSSSSSSQQTSSTASQSSSSSSSATNQGGTTNSGQQTSSTSSGQQTSSGSGQQTSSTSSGQQTSSGSGQQTSSTSSGQQTSSGSSQQTSSTSSGQQTSSSSGQQTSSTSSGQQTSSGSSSTSGQQTTSGSSGQTSSTSSGQQTSSSSGQQTSSTSSGQQTSSGSSSTSGQQTTSGSSGQTSSTSTGQQTSSTSSGQQNSTSSSGQQTSSTASGNNNQTTNQSHQNGGKDECTGEGFFPSSKSCNKFYRCVATEKGGYTKYDFDCGPGTVFDPDYNVCNHPWAVRDEKCRTGGQDNGSEQNSTTPLSNEETTTAHSTSGSSSTPTSKPGQNKPTTSKPGQNTMTTTSKPTTTALTKPTKPSSTSTSPSSANNTPTTKRPSTSSTTKKPESSSSEKPSSSTATPTEPTQAGSDNNNATETPCQNTTKPISKVKCEKAGFYPYPGNCKKFYRCVDWDGDQGKRFSVYYFDCPDGTIFDPSLSTCNHEESVYPPRDCNDVGNTTTESVTPSNNHTSPEETSTPPGESTTLNSTEPLTEPTTSTSESTNYPNSSPAPTEITTSSATETTPPPTGSVTTDSAGTTYPTSSTGSSTLLPSESTTNPTNQLTTTNPTTVDMTTTMTNTPSNEKCPEVGPDQFAIVCPTGFRRHPKYCNLFYQCTTSPNNEIKVLTLSCTNGTIYDDKKIQCLPPDQAKKCDGSMMDTRNLRQMSENSIAPIPVKSEKTICPNEGSSAYKDDCRLFYKCEKDNEGQLNGYLYQCPEGFGYWSISKRCEKIQKVPCGSKRIGGKPTLAPIESKNVGHK